MTTNICPYCPRPLPDRIGAVTCGLSRCQKKHHLFLEMQRYGRSRDDINAKRADARRSWQDGRQCLVCHEAFYVKRKAQEICERPRCRNVRREQLRAQREFEANVERAAHLDLSADQIDRKLAALAAQRKATRSWLRIEDPWQQKPGCALHQRTDVSTYDLEGALR